MTDRELLELAAKAARIDQPSGNHSIYEEDGRVWDVSVAPWWNPLTDDGDALRLAVRLGMRIDTPKNPGDGTSATPLRWSTAGAVAFRDDALEQTRRAIVMCAAEIGKAMP